MSIYTENSNINIESNLASLIDSNNYYTPALSNIYEISIFAGSTSGNSSVIESAVGERFQHFAKFHATDISINGESISFERHPVTKTFYLGSSSVTSSPFSRVDDINITWRESNDWFIKRYHEAWIGLFYDKDKDTFKSVTEGTGGLYRTFKIKFPFRGEGNNSLILIAENVLPTSTGNLSLSWGNNPSLINHNMTYKVERLYWENAPEII